MGSCQSRGADEVRGGGVAATGFDVVMHKPFQDTASAHSRDDGSLVLRRGPSSSQPPQKKAMLMMMVSPSERTTATAPETPSYPQFNSSFTPSNTNETVSASRFSFVSPLTNSHPAELEEEDHYDSSSAGGLESHSRDLNPNHSVIESVITEEESLTAPSDEDDDILSTSQASLQQSSLPRRRHHHRKASAKAQKRVEEAIQMRLLNKRVTTPESIVFRPAPLIAPPKASPTSSNGSLHPDIPTEVVGKTKLPKTSVNPQTIANFNRLKIQVELAEQNDMHRRRKEKVEDRLEDVKGYRSLWKEFESMKEKVTERTDSDGTGNKSTAEAPKAMDLKESTTWYFDFQSLYAKNRHINDDDGDDDNRSQSSMSLLSEVTMETQRKYFETKRRERRNKRSSHPNMAQEKKAPKPKKASSRSFVASDDKSVVSDRSTTSRASTSFLRGKTNHSHGGSDYGPVREGESTSSSMMDMTYDIGSDDSTPRTRTGRDASRASYYDESASVISELELDVDNDYNVPRRHRARHRSHADDSSLETYEDRSFDSAGNLNPRHVVEVDMANFTPRMMNRADEEKKTDSMDRAPATDEQPFVTRSLSAAAYRSTPSSRVQQYGFDPSAPLSSQLALFADSVTPKENPKGHTAGNECSNNDEGKKNIPKTPDLARRLDGLFVNDEDRRDEAIDQLPRKDQISKTPSPSVKTAVEEVPPNIIIESKTPDPIKKSSRALEAVTTPSSKNNNYSPYEIMSPSQFLMMASFHDPSYLTRDREEEDVEDIINTIIDQVENDDTMMIPSPTQQQESKTDENECTDIDDKENTRNSFVEDSPLKVPSSENKEKKTPGMKTFDPAIYSLSSEAFLSLSSWHNRSLPSDFDPLSTSGRNEELAGEEGSEYPNNKDTDMGNHWDLEKEEMTIPDLEVMDADISRASMEMNGSDHWTASTGTKSNPPIMGPEIMMEDISNQLTDAVDDLLQKFRNSGFD